MQRTIQIRFESIMLLCMLLVLGLSVISPLIASDSFPQAISTSTEDKEFDEEERELEDLLKHSLSADALSVEWHQGIVRVGHVLCDHTFEFELLAHPQRGPPR